MNRRNRVAVADRADDHGSWRTADLPLGYERLGEKQWVEFRMSTRGRNRQSLGDDQGEL